MWSVYLIATEKRTYVGCTTDPMRRLRQHNREIRGGARATKHGAGQWQFVIYVTGFPNRSSACRFERLVKCRSKGIGGRQKALMDLTQGICPKGPKNYIVPNNLVAVTYEI